MKKTVINSNLSLKLQEKKAKSMLTASLKNTKQHLNAHFIGTVNIHAKVILS